MYELLIGSCPTGISVVPDSTHPDMWRIKDRDGILSDMLNLTRAKDAALFWARPRGLGGAERAQWHIRESALEMPTRDKRAAA
jgi:hypothetical protein